MRDIPFLFSGDMVRSLLADEKTQTRRVVKLPTGSVECNCAMPRWSHAYGLWHCGICGAGMHLRGNAAVGMPARYGMPGDRLWGRETWQAVSFAATESYQARYRVDGAIGGEVIDWTGPLAEQAGRFSAGELTWFPSIHMPRWACRIERDITAVRIERLQSCSEADAIAEGCGRNHNGYYWGGPHPAGGRKQLTSAVEAYRDLWDSINGGGPNAWAANPLVWVIEFRRLEQPR